MSIPMTQVADSKTRLAAALVGTLRECGFKGFLAGLAPRQNFFFHLLRPYCLGAHRTFTFHLVLLPLCPDTLVELLLFVYFNLCAQACEENCNGCPCLDCLRENALCHGSEKLDLEVARAAITLKNQSSTRPMQPFRAGISVFYAFYEINMVMGDE